MKRLTMSGPIAVFSDVHGNLPGLEAILADIERRGVDTFLGRRTLSGEKDGQNNCADGGEPSAGLIFDQQRAEGAASLAWSERATRPETRAYLRTLEDRLVLTTPAGDLLAVHGSPRRINEYLFEDRPETAMARMAAANPYRAIVFGHTHIPYVREIAGTAFVNVGSAGRPKDGDWRVCYALIDPRAPGDGPLAAFAVEFVRLEFDYERLSAALAETTLITTFDGPGDPAGRETTPVSG